MLRSHPPFAARPRRARPALLCLFAIAAACAPGEPAVPDGAVGVHVEKVVVDPRTASPIVLLQENHGERVLPIWVGFPEAHSIANEMERRESPRPNTHDLAKRLLDGLEGAVHHVVVTDLREGTYYATLVITRESQTVEIDARPSDAIAIALRVRAPLYVRAALFDRAEEATGSDTGAEI